jgi:predicted methyltransferase
VRQGNLFTRTHHGIVGNAPFFSLLVGMAATIIACSPEAQPVASEEAASAVPQDAVATPLDRSVLDDPTRPDADRAEDSGRRAIDVYEWLGMQPGMTVADLWPAEGYNTHLMSRLMGADGHVLSVLGFFGLDTDYSTREGLQQRIQDHGMSNIELLSKLADMRSGSVDVMVAVRSYHDLGTVPGPSRPEAVAEMHRALKPGGVVGIVEAASDKPGWDPETHRLSEQTVIDEFTAAGFELSERSDMLGNPTDDRSKTGFEEGTYDGRHDTDRYLLKFTKPTS